MADLTGNIGEWSEVYAFLKLLYDGKIYAADDNLSPMDDMYLPIIKIQREEIEGTQIDYRREDMIQIYLNGVYQNSLPLDSFKQAGERLYKELKELFKRKEKGTLSLQESGIEDFLQALSIHKIKANSTQKTDITMEIIDIHTGFSPLVGFSIKSQLGSPSTLLNASKATNFVFKISGIDDQAMETINAIKTNSKIIDRFQQIYSLTSDVEFVGVANDKFASNLEMIDSRMAEIIAHIAIYRYRDNVKTLQKIVERLAQDNPLNYRNPQTYAYKIKKLLSAFALGMLPASQWDGIDEANGGYIIVKSNGDILAYYLYNRNAFENYLLKSTKLETGDTKRHKFATIYKINAEYFINMNLQIRFKA